MNAFIRLIVPVLLLSSTAVSAQPKELPDSIRIELPDVQSIVTFELRQYETGKELIRNFPDQLGKLLLHVRACVTVQKLEEAKIVEVVYSEEDVMEYDLKLYNPAPPTTRVRINREAITELLPPGWELCIRMKHAAIHIYAPDFDRLEKLAQTSLEPVITHLDADPETLRQKRMGIISRIVLKAGKVEYAATSHRTPEDMLGLHAGAGVGLLHDKLYPEFNFTTSFYFANRYRANFQRISAHYELKLFAAQNNEGDYRAFPASFLSLSYGLNFQKDRPRWNAIGVGLLVNNKSDFFSGNTMKIFLETDIGSAKLNLIPELYLTDDYKKTLFGIKLNYKF